MNSRTQMHIRNHVPHLIDRPRMSINSLTSIVSPVYRNAVVSVLGSPINRRSTFSNLPFHSATDTSLPQPLRQSEPFIKKPKNYKNINKSQTVNQPSLNTSTRNTSQISNQDIRSQIEKTKETKKHKNKLNSLLQYQKQQCLLSTMLPSSDNCFVKIKTCQNTRREPHKQLFDELKYRMVESTVMVESNINHFQIQESVIQQRQLLDNFTLLKQISKNQFIAIEKNVGFCLVVKVVPIEEMKQVICELKKAKISHPTLIKTFQCSINSNASFLILREYYQQYFNQNIHKYSSKQLLLFVQQLINLFEYLCEKKLKYTQRLSQNLVVCNSTCRLLITSKSIDRKDSNQTLQSLCSPLLQFIYQVRLFIKNTKTKEKLDEVYKLLKKGTPFSEILKNGLLVER